MDLYILNTNLDEISVLDMFESFIWTERYREPGDFEIYTSVNSNILHTLQQDFYITIRESKKAMIVEKIRIDSDPEKGNYVTVSGRSLESILDRRVIWGQETISGNLQNGVKKLLDLCIISPANTNRKIDNFIFRESSDPRITELEIEAQYTGDNLLDVIQVICNDYDIGFKVTLEDKTFIFELYCGEDRTYAQIENPYVVFSPKYENILNSNYIESKASYKNVNLVGGEGEGAARKYTAVGDVVGLERREMFTDARDMSSDLGNDVYLTNAQYMDQLYQRGSEKLSENKEVITFEGSIETTRMFVYREDFDNGDIIQLTNEYGHEARARILEIVIAEDNNGRSIYPTFTTITDDEIA